MRESISRLLPLPLSAVLLMAVIAPVSAEQWEVLIQGNPAGFMEIVTPRDGQMQCHFEYNDRGRGPNLDNRVVLTAKDGAIDEPADLYEAIGVAQ